MNLVLHKATAISVGAKNQLSGFTPEKSFQLTVTGTGAVTAAATIYVSVDGISYKPLLSLSASGTTTATDILVANAPHPYAYADITGITGTGAVATVSMGS